MKKGSDTGDDLISLRNRFKLSLAQSKLFLKIRISLNFCGD
jgi:hypothetical protein